MKKIVLVVLILIAVPIIAAAAERFPEKTWEVSFFSDSEGGAPFPFIGYFFQDNLEGVVHFGYSNIEVDAGQGNEIETKSMFLEAGVLYNIPTSSKIVPVIGGFIQYIDMEETVGTTTDDMSGFALEADFGVRFMVTDRSAVTPKVSILIGDLDLKSGGSSTSADLTGISLGLGYSLFF